MQPFGPTGFKKVIFHESLLIFSIFLLFRSYIFSHVFTPLFNKTTVNVQPLSPPVFDKIAKNSKNLRVFILVSYLNCICIFSKRCCYFR